jgi:hypothetical protein
MYKFINFKKYIKKKKPGHWVFQNIYNNDDLMKFKQSPEKEVCCFWEAFLGGRVGGTGKVQLH